MVNIIFGYVDRKMFCKIYFQARVWNGKKYNYSCFKKVGASVVVRLVSWQLDPSALRKKMKMKKKKQGANDKWTMYNSLKSFRI